MLGRRLTPNAASHTLILLATLAAGLGMLAPTLLAPWTDGYVCEVLGETSPEAEIEKEEIEAATTHVDASLTADVVFVPVNPGRSAASQTPVGAPPTPPPEQIG